MRRRAIMHLAALLAALCLLCGCAPADLNVPGDQTPAVQEETPYEHMLQDDVPPQEEPEIAEPETPEEPEEPARVSFVAVGDNLIHNTIFRAAKQADGSYDFSSMYAPVQDLIEAADLAYVNQEAPLSGEEPSGYPQFNSPQDVGRDLVAAGFDIVNQANNHSMDRYAKGVLATAAFWKTVPEALMIGMYESQEARMEPKIIEKNGIRIGIVTYTYGTNGIPLPADKPYLVPLIDREAIAQDVAALEGKCDIIMASMHWGAEYRLTPTDEQRALAQYLTSLGVKLIVGMHPHVIEPMEWIEDESGNRALCMYSLGNFISSQQKRDTMLGAMMHVTIEKAADGSVSLTDAFVTPLVTHYEKGGKNYQVIPLADYTEELAAKHAVNAYDKPVSAAYFSELAQEVFGAFLTGANHTEEGAVS